MGAVLLVCVCVVMSVLVREVSMLCTLPTDPELSL